MHAVSASVLVDRVGEMNERIDVLANTVNKYLVHNDSQVP